MLINCPADSLINLFPEVPAYFLHVVSHRMLNSKYLQILLRGTFSL